MRMTSSTTQRVQRFWLAAMIAVGCGLTVTPANAQDSEAAIVLAIDKDAIAPQQATGFTYASINATIAASGLRDVLPAFANHVGEQIVLPSGVVGAEGWFALAATPASWATAPDGADGLQNFVFARAGLGVPAEDGQGPSQLQSVEGVVPLRAAGLQALVGKSVCAVVFADDIPLNLSGTSLAGPTLGLAAFTVVGVSGGDTDTLPSVEIQVNEASTCSGPLATFTNAPAVQ